MDVPDTPFRAYFVGCKRVFPLWSQLDQRNGAVRSAHLCNQLKTKSLTHVLCDAVNRLMQLTTLRCRLENKSKISDRNTLLKQQPHDRKQNIHRDFVGHQFIQHPPIGIGTLGVSQIDHFIKPPSQRFMR